jgi:nicotinate-nucleotide adenylyltransferase
MSGDALALYGGTFDPIHLGHTRVAQAAREACGFATLRLLPAADPPLRAAPGASAVHRLAMAHLACEDLPGFAVDDRELRRAGPSFTVDTLAEVRAEIGPVRPLVWLLGRDAIDRIDRWHRYEALLEFAHFLVLDRPGATLEEGAPPPSAAATAWVGHHRRSDLRALHASPAGGLFFLDGPRIPISATAVRRACASGAGAAGLLAPKVWSYICRHGLYGTDGKGAVPVPPGASASSCMPTTGPRR